MLGIILGCCAAAQIKTKKPRLESQNKITSYTIENNNLFIDLHESILGYYGDAMTQKFNKQYADHQKALQNNSLGFDTIDQTKVKRCQDTIKRYTNISNRIKTLKLTMNNDYIASFEPSAINQKYRNIDNDNALKILWCNQKLNNIGLELIMLMGVNRNLYYKAYIELLNQMVVPIDRSRTTTNRVGSKNFVGSEEFRLYKLLGNIFKETCTFNLGEISEINEANTLSKKDKITQEEYYMNDLIHLPSFFYDNFIRTTVLKDNKLLASIYNKIVKTNGYIGGRCFYEFCIPEKPLLFLIIPGFSLLQKKFDDAWISNESSKIQIIDMLAKLDILLKITKYVYCQFHPDCYRNLIEFCIENNIYKPILNTIEILISAVINFHDYDVIPEKNNALYNAVKNKRTKSYESTITTSIPTALSDTKVSTLTIKATNKNLTLLKIRSRQLDHFTIDIATKTYIVIYEMSPTNITHKNIKLMKNLDADSYSVSSDIYTIEYIRKMWSNKSAIKSITNRFITFEFLIDECKKHSNKPNLNITELYTFFIIQLFQADYKNTTNTMHVTMKDKVDNIVDILGEKNTNIEVSHDFICLLLQNSMLWFKEVFNDTIIEEEPFEFFIDALEYLELLIYRFNHDTLCLDVCNYIQNISNFIYCVYNLYVDSYEYESIHYIR